MGFYKKSKFTIEGWGLSENKNTPEIKVRKKWNLKKSYLIMLKKYPLLGFRAKPLGQDMEEKLKI
ncbi:hypothetical protein [Allomuricauda sp. NBRC 101325]|uniref:hypothetical protein n=1 Tax=Allomuricauda sp. NBRC 101325 TaxID=1113758 RepID=UPI0024A0F268|nr:hypothetical protein [Muricauda sp. NBRC 101325]GLU43271.1 hypothetical protein Musp01_08950 [Muricauda sp. NBRC 101325]